MKYLYLASKRGAQGRGGQPVARAGARALLGAVATSRARCSARRSPTSSSRVHTGGDVAFLNGVLKVLLADGRRSTATFVARAHRRASTSCSRELERRVVRRPRAAVGRDRAPTWSASPGCTRRRRRAVLVWSMGITQHALRRRQRARDRQPRRWRAATSAGRAPGSCRSAATRACRAAPRWAPTPRRSRAASPIDRRDRGRARRAVRLRRSPTAPGPHRGGDGRGRAAAASSTCSTRAAATSSTCCPTRTSSRAALARVPLRVHQDIVVTHQMLVDPGEAVVLLPAATRYEQRGRRHRDHHRAPRRVQPRDPGPARRARRAASGRSSPTSPRRVRPERAPTSRLRDRPRRSATRSRASCPSTRASSTCAKTGDAIQWGGARLCDGGAFPTPDGKAHFAVVAPARAPTCPTGSFVLSTRRGKQFNTMVLEQKDPLTGAARDALFIAPSRRRRALGVARRRSRCSCAREHGEMQRAGARRADPARQRAGVLPRGQRAAARRPRAIPLGRARLQRGRRRSRPRPVTPDDLARPASTSPLARAARRARRARPRPSAARAPIAPGQYAPRPRRRRRPCSRCCDAAGRAIVSEESGVHRPRRRRRSPSCSTPSTAPPTARAASRTGRSRCARSTPTARWCALVANQADRRAHHRGPGRGRASATATRSRRRATTGVEDAVVALSGWPPVAAAVEAVPRARLGRARAVRRRRGRPRRLPRRPCRPARAVGLPRRAARVPRSGRDRSSTPHGRELVDRRRRRPPPARRRRHAGARSSALHGRRRRR